MLFAGQLAFAQAWQGKGDQKLQVGFNGYGNGTGITGTYDYGVSDVISLSGAGANFTLTVIKTTTKFFLVE